jgi:hypothetical protein
MLNDLKKKRKTEWKAEFCSTDKLNFSVIKRSKAKFYSLIFKVFDNEPLL